MKVELADCKVDTVRAVIDQAYKTRIGTVYVIPDGGKMSLAAKNAILKVTEEPPNNAYFILELEDEEQTLNTIRSRGTVFKMDNYTPHELADYYYDYFNGADVTNNGVDVECTIIQDICEHPGDVNIFMSMNGIEFYNYVKKVFNNVLEVSLPNALKIAEKIKFKDTDEDKYDLKLFWRAFCCIVLNEATRNIHDIELVSKYTEMIEITCKYINQLNINGISKPATFDMWIMELRGE